MALPTWQADGTAVGGAAGFNVSWPGHLTDDIGLLLVNTSNQALATPAGWTLVGTTGTGTAATADSAAIYVFWKRATSGAEPVAVIPDSGDHQVAVIVTFRGCVLTGPPVDVFATSIKAANATTSTLPEVTTSGADRLVVACISTGQESVQSAWSMAGLSSFTARGFGTTTAGVDGGIACASGGKATAGATGTGSVTHSITSKAAMLTLALRPNAIYFPLKWMPRWMLSDRAFDWTIQVAGRAASSWAITAGALPAGVTLNTSTGLFSGTATAADGSSHTFTVQATDSLGNTDSFQWTVKVRKKGGYDDYQVIRYVGDGAASRVIKTNSVDLSGGGVVLLFDLTNQVPSSRLLASFNGTAVMDSEFDWRSTTPRTGGAFANASFVTPDDHNVSGNEYVAYAFRKVAGLVDVIEYTGNGSTQNVPHSTGYFPGLFLTRPKTAAGGVWGRHSSRGSDIAWTQDNGGKADTTKWGTFSTTNCGLKASTDVNANTVVYLAVLFMNNDVITAFEVTGNGSSSGPVLVTGSLLGKPRAAIYGAAGASIALAAAPKFFDLERNPTNLWSGSPDYGRPLYAGTSMAATQNVFSSSGESLQIVTSHADFNTNNQLYTYLFFTDEPKAQTVSPTGIATAQAFGTAVVTIGASAQTVTPTGIASGEAFGAASVTPGGVTVSPGAIDSAEALGVPSVNASNTIAPSAIDSEQALGTPAMVVGGVVVSPSSIASSEAVGSPTVSGAAVFVTAIAIESGEAFGSPVVTSLATVSPASIGSAEAFGAASVTPGAVSVSPGAVASAETVPAPTLTSLATVSPAAIGSDEAVGSPTLVATATISPVAIASAEAAGTPTINPGAVSVAPAGIGSAEAVGTPTLTATAQVAPAAIASAETLGIPSVTTLATVSPAGIASAEAFGTATVIANLSVYPAAIGTAEAVGTPAVNPGGVTVSPAGIGSEGALGTPALSTANTITPPGIVSSEALGTPSVAPGGVTAAATGIGSSEAFGTPSLLPGGVIVSPTGIPSGEAVGSGAVTNNSDQAIQPIGIGSAEAFGAGTYLRIASTLLAQIADRPDSWPDGEVLRPSDPANSQVRPSDAAQSTSRDTDATATAQRQGADTATTTRDRDDTLTASR